MLLVVLNQVLQFATAGVQHTSKVQGNVGGVVGIGLAEFV
jgi:hypothetical protein